MMSEKIVEVMNSIGFFTALEKIREWCSLLTEKYLELAALSGLSPLMLGIVILIGIFIVLYILSGISFFRFLMRLYQRLLLLTGLCALGMYLFYIGREHQIFLDNKTLGEYKALEQVNVSINGDETVELMTRERGVKKAVGPEFELRAEIFDENGEIVNTITKTIAVNCSKDIMINLPALAGGSENFIVPAPR